MKLAYVITMLACLGGVLTNECARLNSYSAVGFDIRHFVPSQAYFDAPYYFYFDNINDNGSQFFDLEEGVIYFKNADGTCDKFESNDFNLRSLSVDALNTGTKEILRFTDNAGETRVGKTFTNNKFLMKALFTSQCLNYYISFYNNNVLESSYIFINAQTLSDDDLETLETARAEFKALSCRTKL